MKIKVLFIISLLSISIVYFACNSEKDNIKFNVDIIEIVDSLEVIQKYFNKHEGFKSYYYDDNNYFYINSKKLFKVDSWDSIVSLNMLNSLEYLELDETEQNIFRLSMYLRLHRIDGAYLDRILGCYMFNYMSEIDDSFDTVRDLILVKQKDKKFIGRINRTNIIIDNKGDLILVKPRRIN